MADAVTRTLLDTSVLIASPDRFAPRDEQTAAISVITLGELRAGVALAGDPLTRTARQARLAAVRQAFRSLAVDDQVADAYGEILAAARRERRMTKATDLLIIATARSSGRLLRTLDHSQAQLAEAVGVVTRS